MAAGTETSTAESEYGKFVEITINGQEFRIDRGRETVTDIKNVGHVPNADELERVLDGRLHPLPDDASVEIKGGEVFVSHPRGGGSS